MGIARRPRLTRGCRVPAGDPPWPTALARGRREIAQPSIDLVGRAELVRCAARVASLVFEPCQGFEKLRADAAAPERAYADYLAAQVQPQDIELLPPQHRAVAATTLSAEAATATLRAIEDPLSRLVAIGVMFQSERAHPTAIALAADTASAQDGARPLLAWLNVQLALADKAGDAARPRGYVGGSQ